MKLGRKTLIELRSSAEEKAAMLWSNPAWVRAYTRLVDAADHLDAMIARLMASTAPAVEPDDPADWWKEPQ